MIQIPEGPATYFMPPYISAAFKCSLIKALVGGLCSECFSATDHSNSSILLPVDEVFWADKNPTKLVNCSFQCRLWSLHTFHICWNASQLVWVSVVQAVNLVHLDKWIILFLWRVTVTFIIHFLPHPLYPDCLRGLMFSLNCHILLLSQMLSCVAAFGYVCSYSSFLYSPAPCVNSNVHQVYVYHCCILHLSAVIAFGSWAGCQ